MKALILILGLLGGAMAFAHGGHDHGDHNHPPMHHLTFAGGAVHAHATWTVGPQVAGESVLRVEWKNGADHSPVEPPGTFEVVPWMPSMGHGSSPTQIERVLGEQGEALVGAYEVSGIYFFMGGAWDLRVTLTSPDGVRETQTIHLELSGEGGHHH